MQSSLVSSTTGSMPAKAVMPMFNGRVDPQFAEALSKVSPQAQAKAQSTADQASTSAATAAQQASQAAADAKDIKDKSDRMFQHSLRKP